MIFEEYEPLGLLKGISNSEVEDKSPSLSSIARSSIHFSNTRYSKYSSTILLKFLPSFLAYFLTSSNRSFLILRVSFLFSICIFSKYIYINK